MTARASERVSLDRLRLLPDELAAFLDDVFPAATRPHLGQLVSVAPGRVRTTLQPLPSMTRPGGTVSGPILMGVIDFAAYAVVLAHIGPRGDGGHQHAVGELPATVPT